MKTTYYIGRFIFRWRWILYIATFVPMVFIKWHETRHWLIWPIGGFLVFLGSWTRVYAARYIGWKAKPEDPMKRILTTDGPYRITRNPLYWGNIIGFGGSAVMFGLLWYIPIAVGVIFLLHHLLITWYEENRMREKYGAEYEEYCKKVPRWGPKLSGATPHEIRPEFPWGRVLLAELGTLAGFFGTIILALVKEFYL
ncbi:MAG: isoprenylcysteine carboxylmethyltransferase family protein [Planctomycetes bacterium]|nr:isoprenylcysteine carboxylmethyltransferase family protein [Planctomycetota bacterium]